MIVVKSQAEFEELHKDLFKLGDWAIEWQIRANVSNYKKIHIRVESPTYT